MRKALIGLIMAATAITPIAAQAQEGWRGRGDRGGQTRQQNESGDTRAERRAQRQAERQAQPQQVQVQVAQPQPAPQPAPQVEQRRYRGGGDGTRDGRRGERTRQPSIYPQTWQGNPNSPDLRRYQQLEQRNQQRYDGRGDWRQDRRGDRRTDWNRTWRNDRRYDWNSWRYRNRNIFNLGSYYSPYRNHRYSRFSIGFFLEPLFYNQRYWIGDPWQYRLPPAPYGTQWVRYYDDVLLVDVYTGEVIDVIYGFFW